MKFIVGSTSPIKLDATRSILGQLLKEKDYDVVGIEVDSGVPLTPWGQQTYDGARNRANGVKARMPEADYWIGLESGLVDRYGHVFEEAWVCVLTSHGMEYMGFSSGLRVPDFVLSEMAKNNEEHRHVMRRLRVSPEAPKDTWGDYTGNLLLRTISIEESLRNALVQIFSPQHSYYHRTS